MLINQDTEGIMVCRESKLRYKEIGNGLLLCLDLDEDAPLPEKLAVGKALYDELKAGICKV